MPKEKGAAVKTKTRRERVSAVQCEASVASPQEVVKKHARASFLFLPQCLFFLASRTTVKKKEYTA